MEELNLVKEQLARLPTRSEIPWRSTDLSEVLLVTRKRRMAEPKDPQVACTFINLWRKPVATADALALGERIGAASGAAIGEGDPPSHGVTPLQIGAEKWGEAISIPLADL